MMAKRRAAETNGAGLFETNFHPAKTTMQGLGAEVVVKKIKGFEKINPQPWIWITSRKIPIRLCDMATPHLLNAIHITRQGRPIGMNRPDTSGIEVRPGGFVTQNGVSRGRLAETREGGMIFFPSGNGTPPYWYSQNKEEVDLAYQECQRAGPEAQLRETGAGYNSEALLKLGIDRIDAQCCAETPIYQYMILEAARRGFKVV